jgi:hypothetical protein
MGGVDRILLRQVDIAIIVKEPPKLFLASALDLDLREVYCCCLWVL